MADGFVAVDPLDLKNLQAYLSRLPDAAGDAAVDEICKTLINVLQTEQPKPRYVTRKAAYGVSFFTVKQRRWFFWALGTGRIKVPYRRTQGLRKGWKQLGQGKKSLIVNERDGAEFVVGDRTQSRHEKLVGWKTTGAVVEQHRQKLEKAAVAAVNKALRALK